MNAPTLVVVCGLPGSGKTTLATQLARERPGIRLCPDEWMAALEVDIWDSGFRERLERLQSSLAADLLRCGTTAIVEWGTWAREERDALRVLAGESGARTELIVLDPPLHVLWGRVRVRAAEDPPMTRDDLVRADELFQRPDDAEAAAYDACTRLGS